MDFPHQQLTFLFLLPTLHVVGEPPEFLVAGIERIASWSEAEGRLSSSPHQKEEMRAAERSSTNSCAVVVPRQQRDPPLNVWPDLSGDLLLSAMFFPFPVFLCVSFSSLFHSAIFTSLQAWRSRRSFSSCCRSRFSTSARLLANPAS